MQFCSDASPQKCNCHGPMILDVGQRNLHTHMQTFRRTFLLNSVYYGIAAMAIVGIFNFNDKLLGKLALPVILIIAMYVWYKYDSIILNIDSISIKGKNIKNSELESVVVKEKFVYLYRIGFDDPLVITCGHYDNSDELVDKIKYIFINKIK